MSGHFKVGAYYHMIKNLPLRIGVSKDMAVAAGKIVKCTDALQDHEIDPMGQTDMHLASFEGVEPCRGQLRGMWYWKTDWTTLVRGPLEQPTMDGIG